MRAEGVEVSETSPDVAARNYKNLGVHVYGFAAIALGLIGLVSGDFASVWQPVPEGIPLRSGLAYLCAACFLAGGLAIQWRRTARVGSLLVAFLFLIFALLWAPRVIGFPRMIGTWLGFAEQFALVSGGIIAFTSVAPPDTMWANRTSQIFRVLFGLCLFSFGLAHFIALKETTGMVPKWIPPGQQFWAIATGVGHLLASVAIITGLQAVLASRLFTAMLISFGALVWAPILFAHPEVHMNWAGNAVNLAMIGSAWTVADSIGAAAVRGKLARGG